MKTLHNRPEFDLHLVCIQYLSLKYENKGLCFSHHSPNETISIKDKKVMYQQNKFTRMGRKLGFPDLQIFYQSQSILIEFKSPKGKLSLNQINTINMLAKQSFKTYIVKTFPEFQSIVDKLFAS